MPTALHVDAVRCAHLRADLIAADYTANAVRGAWGAVADDALGRGLVAPALAALEGRSDPLAVLCRLLFMGRRQPAAHVAAALAHTGVDGLVALGFARQDEGDIVPEVLLRPQDFSDPLGGGGWWIVSDLDETALGGALPTDHVLGVGGASLTLAGLQLTSPAERVLDVGSGCGIQALRASRVAASVVATDISERALALTRINALLNEVDGIETRAGSLFEPVIGERFDRVVSNPPFVITPRVAGVPAYEYRDGGLAGDAIVEAFVTGVADVLAPGGTAQLLGNWEYRGDEDGLERVRAWAAAASVPLDVWVVERELLDPLAYAELWVRDGGTVPGAAEYERLITAWLDDFAARGVTGIGFGYILLRRPLGEAATLSRFERLGQPVQGALGPHLTAALAAHDRWAHSDDVALAATALAVASDVTEARHHTPGSEDPSVIELRQGGGFARVLDVDPALAALVGACDGDLPVGVLIDAIAQLMEVDAVALRADLLPRVRELLFTGMLRTTV